MEREDLLLQETKITFLNLVDAISLYDEEAFNLVPFEGSWTAGQVTEHIIKSIGDIPDEKTGQAGRPYDEKVEPIKAMFLNMELKFETDPFIAPGLPPHDKHEALHTIKQLRDTHLVFASRPDLDALCMDMELPTFGYLTRYEWLKFMLFHTQRHTMQLSNIHKALSS